MKEDNIENSGQFLKNKLKEIKRICKDDTLTDEEKIYLIELVSKKMEKILESKFFKSLDEIDEPEQ